MIKLEWLSVLVILVIQTAGIVWWASNLDTRVGQVEAFIDKGDRFTLSRGVALEGQVRSNTEDIKQFVNTSNRTHEKIDELKDAVNEMIISVKVHDHKENKIR